MVRKTLSVVVMGVFVCGAVFATCGICASEDMGGGGKSAAVTAPVKVNNTICPVTGEKVDMNNPVTVEYDGKIYNLCCPMCPAEFKKDPAKYIAIVESQRK